MGPGPVPGDIRAAVGLAAAVGREAAAADAFPAAAVRREAGEGPMATQMMSAEDHARVTTAIQDAEAKSAGEIYCVLTNSSDTYFFPAAFLLALAILAVSLVVGYVLEHWWYDMK